MEVEYTARLQAEKLLAPLQSQLDVKDEQIKALTAALKALPQQSDIPNAKQRIQEAELEIVSGKTGKAQAIYRDVLKQKKSEGKAANREAAEAARRLGTLAFLHDTEVALDAYRQAVLLEPENAYGWNELGHLLLRTGDFDEAINAYTKVSDIGHKTDNQALLATSYSNLGNLYQQRGDDLDQAETMCRKSLLINEALGDKEGIAIVYANLGNVYRTRGDLDQAETMYHKSLSISEALGSKQGMAGACGNLGNVYKSRGNLEQAESMYLKSLSLFKETGEKHQAAKIERLLEKLFSPE